jgi:hypothetical protein
MNKRPSTYSSPRICDTCKHSIRATEHSFTPEYGPYILCSQGAGPAFDIVHALHTLPTVYQGGTCFQWASKIKMEEE